VVWWGGGMWPVAVAVWPAACGLMPGAGSVLVLVLVLVPGALCARVISGLGFSA
jgi:hypothetical protein